MPCNHKFKKYLKAKYLYFVLLGFISCSTSSEFSENTISNLVLDFSNTDDFVIHEVEVYEYEKKKIAFQLMDGVPIDSLKYIDEESVPEKINKYFWYENDKNVFCFFINENKLPQNVTSIDYTKINLLSQDELNYVEGVYVKTKTGTYKVNWSGGMRISDRHYYQILGGLGGLDSYISFSPNIDAYQIKVMKDLDFFTNKNEKKVYDNGQGYFKRAIGYKQYDCAFVFHYKYDYGSFSIYPKVGILSTWGGKSDTGIGIFTKTIAINGKSVEEFFKDYCEKEKE